MSDDLPLSVKWKSLVDFFTCPVCMCHLQDTHMTPCGHRYCNKCIRECIDRHRKCPCCNKVIQQSHLIKDHQFDDLVVMALQQRDSSEREYFDQIINAATAANSGDSLREHDTMRKVLSPVEEILKKHIKNSLASHETYYQELKTEYLRKKDKLSSDIEHKEEELQRLGLGHQELAQRIELLQSEFADHTKSLEDDIERCGKMVATAFDNYLSQHIPSLSILPVTVTLSILNKSIEVRDITLKPNDSMVDVKRLLRLDMEARGDRIQEFGEDVKFVCFGPLARRSLYEMHRMASDVIELGATHHDIVILPDQCRPVIQFGIKPGSVIAVYGRVRCQSDMPKTCFAKAFQADLGLTVDYFTCKDCGFNWVCRSCMEDCHKDHNIIPYIMNHKPTWACCYCPKKKKCCIQNN